MIEIVFDNKDKFLPESWSEIPKNKLLRILELVFVTPASGKSYHELLRLLLDITSKDWQKMMKQYFNPKLSEEKQTKNAETLQELLQLVSWLWTDNMTKKPFDYIEIEGNLINTKLYLFEEGFKSMSFGEMTDAYIHAHAYIKQLEEGDERLNKFIATVCRPRIGITPKGWNGDVRIEYNAFRAESDADRLKEVPAEQKMLILVYFLGTLKDFLSFYDIYSTEDGPPKEEEYPGQSYIKNQHALAEKGVFGNMEATKKTNVHDVFLFLEESKKDIEELKRKQKTDDNNG